MEPGIEKNSSSSVLHDYSQDMYREISKTACADLKNFVHAVHCCIYAKWDSQVFDKLHAKAAVLMQMRSDGMLGFPGGVIDENESITEALNRELVEEMNFDTVRFPIVNDHHVVSHINAGRRICLHFYVREVALDEFADIERRTLDAQDYGKETFGMVRVPLFTYEDGVGGLPSFLGNRFVGNSREQLVRFLLTFRILSKNEIANALRASSSSSSSSLEAYCHEEQFLL